VAWEEERRRRGGSASYRLPAITTAQRARGQQRSSLPFPNGTRHIFTLGCLGRLGGDLAETWRRLGNVLAHRRDAIQVRGLIAVGDGSRLRLVQAADPAGSHDAHQRSARQPLTDRAPDQAPWQRDPWGRVIRQGAAVAGISPELQRSSANRIVRLPWHSAVQAGKMGSTAPYRASCLWKIESGIWLIPRALLAEAALAGWPGKVRWVAARRVWVDRSDDRE
jgi:hypothetical protein